MNKTKRIAFGIGLVLVVLAAFTASAVADNVMRLEPSDIGCGQGEEVTDVWVYLNATDHVTGFQFHLKYEDDVVDIVNITSAVEGTNPDWLMWDPYWKVDSTTGHHYLFVTGILLTSDVTGDNIELAKITLKGLSPGTRPLEFDGSYGGHDPCEICDIDANVLPLSVVNGTFTCTGPAETFNKVLVNGWNLISLPLTPTNSSTSAVLGNDTIEYDSVHRYNAASKEFEDVTTGTMDPGIGYFVNVTTAGTWSYEGTLPYNSMSIDLKQGLNMIGWLNCSKQISGNLTSIAGKYNYNARWNAGYEVYEPHAPDVFNDFEMMERGEGYWIAAKEDCTLTVSCSG